MRNIVDLKSYINAARGTQSSDVEEIARNLPALRDHLKRAHGVLGNIGSSEGPERSDWLSQVANSLFFRTVTNAIIVLNAVHITYTADWQVENYESRLSGFSRHADVIFLLAFFTELLLRLWRDRLFFFYNKTYLLNWLDLIVVVVGFVDVVVSYAHDEGFTFVRLFSFLRVLKAVRVLRIITMFRTLRTIIESFTSVLLDLFWCSVILAFFLYTFALALVMRVGEYLHEHHDSLVDDEVSMLVKEFGSTKQVVLSLFMSTSGGNDWSVYFEALETTGEFNQAIFLSFILFTTIALMNIILGIFVDRAMKNLQFSKEEKVIKHALEEQTLTEDLVLLCQEGDADGDGKLTGDEWDTLYSRGKLSSYMHMHGFCPRSLQEWFTLCEASSADGKVSIDSLVTGCMRMKGPSSSFDLHTVKAEIRGLLQAQQETHQDILESKYLVQEEFARLRARL